MSGDSAKARSDAAVGPSDAGGDVVIDSGVTHTDANATPDGSCVPSSATAKPVTGIVTTRSPVALYLMLDRSGSMIDMPVGNASTKWDQLVGSMNAFVTDPDSANLDVAVGFFPIDTGTCDGTNYSSPRVPLARLPDDMQVQAVATAITANAPSAGGGSLGSPGGTGTPIEGALHGAENFCILFHANYPNEQCVVVLVTDGAPNGCNQDFAALAGIAAEARMRANVVTFAVGMDGADFGLLDQIASAGASSCGATPSCNVNGTGTRLIDALNKIRTAVTRPTTSGQGTTVPCQYAIPAPAKGQALDPTKLNVQITTNGAVDRPGGVSDREACHKAGDQGWYYDDPAKPEIVTFCPSTCSALEVPDAGVDPGATSSRVEVLFGCETVTVQ